MSVDGEGYLTYRGRQDRMINTGYHIYPQEIEAVVAGIPGVDEVRVLGEPNKEWGQTVVDGLQLASESRAFRSLK